jgi:uncharacterized protein (TIGR03435 family)
MTWLCSIRSINTVGRYAIAAVLLNTLAAQSAFEVASVKFSDPINHPIVSLRAYPGGRVVITTCTLKDIIMRAYRVRRDSITGGPRWVDDDQFDITAKAPAGSAAAAFIPPSDGSLSPALQSMVGSLLADRFGLKFHREIRELPALSLEVVKGGARLQPARDPSAEPRWPALPRSKPEWRSITMRMLVAILDNRYGPIVDNTGLTGSYDFDLTYDPQIRDTGDSNDTPADSSQVSLRTALEEQVGLRLRKTKAPLEFIVIDQAKKPNEN